MDETGTDSNGFHEHWAAFLHGATQPAFSALLIAFGIVLTSIFTFFIVLTDDVLAGPGFRYFMAHDLDTHSRVTHKALSLEPSASPIVAVSGTSVLIRCFVNEPSLATEIQKHAGVSTKVVDLSADGLNIWEMIGLADHIPEGQAGVFVIGITPGLLSFDLDFHRKSIEEPKLGFTSKALDDEAKRAGIDVPTRTGIYSYDNSYFLLAHRHNLLANLFTGGLDYEDPLSASWLQEVNNPDYWEKEISWLPELAEGFEQNHAQNLESIVRLAEVLNTKGNFNIQLVDGPINPGWLDLSHTADFFEKYRRILNDFGEKHDFTVVPINDKAQLRKTDFVDYEGHLGTFDGRARCNDALAESIAKDLVP